MPEERTVSARRQGCRTRHRRASHVQARRNGTRRVRLRSSRDFDRGNSDGLGAMRRGIHDASRTDVHLPFPSTSGGWTVRRHGRRGGCSRDWSSARPPARVEGSDADPSRRRGHHRLQIGQAAVHHRRERAPAGCVCGSALGSCSRTALISRELTPLHWHRRIAR